MKFLCLPGAFGSAKSFEVQLAPFCKELVSDGTASFYFTQGTVPCTPPLAFTDYYGPPPHYRFIEFDGIKGHDILDRLRDFPDGVNPEDVMRELMPKGENDARQNIREALDTLYQTMEDQGPFDGIIGYSEGATIAATMILDEQRRLTDEGREPQIKAAIFFAGWPPIIPETKQLVLLDESDYVIGIPTCHVIGARDPYIHGAMALFNVCEGDVAHLFDHGKGHTIPRDARTIKELGDTVRKMIVESG
ncbi:hypothetical protein B7494_g6245 [Chlorociboria aeruginascens]|nr:hypothetical protein B7494_g6245 [Chlorociboria aeruginascens]